MWLVINLHFPCSYYHYYYYYFFFFPKCIIYNFVSCGVYTIFFFVFLCVIYLVFFFVLLFSGGRNFGNVKKDLRSKSNRVLNNFTGIQRKHWFLYFTFFFFHPLHSQRKANRIKNKKSPNSVSSFYLLGKSVWADDSFHFLCYFNINST